MKCLLTGDFEITEKRLEDLANVFYQPKGILDILERGEYHALILGGDIFREYTPRTVSFMSAFVQDALEKVSEIHFLIGNHDRNIGIDKITATFGGWNKRIRIIESPEVLGAIVYLPAPDRAAFGATREAEGPRQRDAALSDALDASLRFLSDQADKPEECVLIYHAALDAAIFGGKKIASGLTWTVPASEVSRYGMGLGFHIHAPEDYHADRFGTEIHTIGAPVPDTFGVRGETFRVGELEIVDGTISFKSISLPRVIQRIEVDIQREGKRITIGDGEIFILSPANISAPLGLYLDGDADLDGTPLKLKINAYLPEADLSTLPNEETIRSGLEAQGIDISELIFRRIPVNMVKSRLDESARKGLDPSELLGKWAEVSGYEDTKNLEVARMLLEGDEAFGDWNAAGLSGFEPVRTTVHNFRQYENAEIDWTSLSERVAITGVNASGKSNIAKATIFGLYKRTPASPGLDDELRRGTQKGFVEVEFLAGEKRYLVRRVLERNTKGRVSCKSELFEIYANSRDPVCETAREIDAKIVELVGGYDYVVSTFFASEAQIDALTRATFSEWRGHIIEALSLKTFEIFRERSGKKARELDIRAGHLEAAEMEVETLFMDTDGRLDILEDKDVLQSKKTDKERIIKGLETVLIEKKSLRALDKKSLEEIEGKIKEVALTARDALDAEKRFAGAEDRVKKLPVLVEPPAVDDLSFPDLTGERAKVEKLRTGRTAERNKVDVIRLEGESLSRQIEEKQQSIYRKSRELESHKKAFEEKPEVPCTEWTDTIGMIKTECPAFKYWADREGILTLEKDIDALEAKVGDLATAEVKQSSDLMTATGLFNAAEHAVREAEEALALNEKSEREDLEAQKARTSWEAAHIERQDAERNLIDAAAEFKSIENNKAELAEFEVERLNLMLEIDDKKKAVDKIETNILERKKEIRQVEKDISIIETLEETLEGYRQRLKILGHDIKTIRNEEKGWALLEKAFHSTGIPFLLLEEALPAIAEEANRLLASTDLSVSIRSVRENKDGARKDDIEVRYIDPRGEFPLCVASGAQEKLLGIPLRFALAKVGGDFWGTPPRIFVQDEGFGAFHPDRYDQVRDIIRLIAEDFDRFVYITHVTELAEDADIRFETVILEDNLSELRRIQ